jgi:lysozyme
VSYRLIDQVKKHEGFSAVPYRCPTGHLTIGYGWNLETGISEVVAEYILMQQLSDIQLACIREFGWFRDINEARRDVVTNMVFNLGMTGFTKFKKTIAAIEDGDFDKAAEEMVDSRWASQVGYRAYELADQMKLGAWDE